MNRRIFFVLASFIIAAAIPFLASASEAIKLPYEAGQRFVVVQGYDSPPTHIKKDLYAIDFSQDGCDAYGKLAVAAGDGTVLLVQEAGYNGGYGTQVLVVNANRIVARYAHMIPGTIPTGLAIGDAVVQGEPLGEIGNTGLVEGAACPTHPGTHIHFAMYGENADGSFSPFLPEPISNYVGITAGKWYLSDNTLAIATVPGATAIIDRALSAVFGAGTGSSSGGNGVGGVSASVAAPPPQSPPPVAVSTTTPPTASTTTATTTLATAAFNSSTLAVDISWPAVVSATAYQVFSTATSTPIATTTAPNVSYQIMTSDFNVSLQFTIIALFGDGSGIAASGSTIQTAPISLPNWWTVVQPIDDTNSNGSWYNDNWYDLGTGFYGDIRELSLEGFINNPAYFASHLYLEEYLDANYSQLNQSWTISNNAPFTDGLQKITIGGLNIPLQPNKYYRLQTYQEYQNRSVILAGTSATGTAMWDSYIYGVGRVEYQYSFYPYIAAVMIPDYPPLQPPNAPPGMMTSFDSLNSILSFSWSAATDPDTASSLLTYQVNIATSTAGTTPTFDPAQWRDIGKIFSTSTPVEFGNAYTIGVRAVDDLGNIGSPLVEPWNFPAGYYPPPEQLDHSAGVGVGVQEVTFSATTTVAGIALWTQGEFGAWCCSETSISIHQDASGTPGVVIATSDPVRIGPYGSSGERIYNFETSPTLPAGRYWFSLDNGPTILNATDLFGSASGEIYFRIEEGIGP